MWLNIKSFDNYQETFDQSEQDRLSFWDHEAVLFTGENVGIRCKWGVLKKVILSGLSVVN